MKWIIDQPAPGYFSVGLSGKFTVDDSQKMHGDLMAREDWQPGAHVLLDYRGADFTGVTAQDLEAVGHYQAQYRERWGNGRIALLMKKGRDFGLARQYELMNDSLLRSPIMVFEDEADAREWITARAASEQ